MKRDATKAASSPSWKVSLKKNSAPRAGNALQPWPAPYLPTTANLLTVNPLMFHKIYLQRKWAQPQYGVHGIPKCVFCSTCGVYVQMKRCPNSLRWFVSRNWQDTGVSRVFFLEQNAMSHRHLTEDTYCSRFSPAVDRRYVEHEV